MKKYLLTVVVLLVAVVTLTGCGGGKTLSCSKGDESVELEYNGDKIKKVTMKTLIAEADSKEQAEEAKQAGEEQLKSVNENGIDIKIVVEDKKVFFVYNIDIDKVDEDKREQYLGDFVDSDVSYDDMKKEAEDSGYNCK